jgi:hypothetical protein
MRTANGLAYLVFAALGVAALGCDNGDTATTPQKPHPQAAAPKPASQPLVPQVAMVDWCKEHGVPESVCTRCNESLAAGFKAKNDWCKEHGLPDSQCFKHHPELQQKFAVAYKAKYGNEPPSPESVAK